MDQLSLISENIQNALSLKQLLLADKELHITIEQISKKIVECYQNEGKVLFCGNGGSAADSQHLAAELSGRYYYDRPPLSAEALHVNTSYITAVANDYSYNEIYSRLIQGIGKEGDILIGLSTSGNSGNVIQAMKKAKEKGMIVVGFTGQGGGKMQSLLDYHIDIPSTDTPRIQECHMLIGHIICQIVEATLFPRT